MSAPSTPAPGNSPPKPAANPAVTNPMPGPSSVPVIPGSEFVPGNAAASAPPPEPTASAVRLKERLPEAVVALETFRDNTRVIVQQSQLGRVLRYCKQDLGFDMLIDVTCVDYLEYPDATDRFGVVHCLLNTNSGERVVLKTYVNEPDLTIASAYPLWRGADWMEREVYDMFGILFDGHPDLRRILMPDEFAAFPLRKDYPLKGRGERHNFPILTRAES